VADRFDIQYYLPKQSSTTLGGENNDFILAEALLHCHSNVDAFFRGKRPIMKALEHSATKVLKILLQAPKVDIKVQTKLKCALVKTGSWYR
jgi:2C-methyl-D-erythritol 2,4-cyclodiphosphate synthase